MKKIEMVINSQNLDYVKNKVEKFNHKAAQLHKAELTFNYSEAYINSTYPDNIQELINIIMEQNETLIIEGYKIIAKIDHTYPTLNFVKPYTDITAEQEQQWQLLDSNCDHCHINRQRNITFILQNIETKKYIQVGKTCLKDFLNGYDIEKKIKLF